MNVWQGCQVGHGETTPTPTLFCFFWHIPRCGKRLPNHPTLFFSRPPRNVTTRYGSLRGNTRSKKIASRRHVSLIFYRVCPSYVTGCSKMFNSFFFLSLLLLFLFLGMFLPGGPISKCVVVVIPPPPQPHTPTTTPPPFFFTLLLLVIWFIVRLHSKRAETLGWALCRACFAFNYSSSSVFLKNVSPRRIVRMTDGGFTSKNPPPSKKNKRKSRIKMWTFHIKLCLSPAG